MHDHYTASHLALGAARREMTSALPDAPVVTPRSGGLGRSLRTRAASALRRAASALEPVERPDRRLGARVEASAACR
jgi:hypothetical protein